MVAKDRKKIMKNLSFIKLAITVAVTSTIALGGLYSETVHAAAPMAKIPAPGFFRFTLGDFEVTVLSDGTVDLPVDKLLQQAPENTKKELTDVYLNTPTETSVNA